MIFIFVCGIVLQMHSGLVPVLLNSMFHGFLQCELVFGDCVLGLRQMNGLPAISAIEAALFVEGESCIKVIEFAELVWVLGVIINLAECAGPDPLACRIFSITTISQ